MPQRSANEQHRFGDRIFLKDKSAVLIHRRVLGKKRIAGLHFWARGFCVSTVGLDEETIRNYIRDPNCAKEAEIAFLPQKVANRLQKYISANGIGPDGRIFPITYAASRIVVKKAGDLVGIYLKSNDLLRRAATYASRAGTSLEIVSKVMLRHSNLSTTGRYLGKIRDAEAKRWIDKLHR